MYYPLSCETLVYESMRVAFEVFIDVSFGLFLCVSMVYHQLLDSSRSMHLKFPVSELRSQGPLAQDFPELSFLRRRSYSKPEVNDARILIRSIQLIIGSDGFRFR